MPKSWVTVGTAMMVRDFLLSTGPSYVKEIHAHLKTSIEGMEYHPPTYVSTRKLIYVLQQLGLIYLVRSEKTKPWLPEIFDKRFYAVVSGMEEDPRWRNPYAALYYPDKFKQMGELVRIVRPEEWMRRIRKMRSV